MCRDANAMRENHYGKYGDKMQNLYDMNHLVYFKKTNEVKKKKVVEMTARTQRNLNKKKRRTLKMVAE